MYYIRQEKKQKNNDNAHIVKTHDMRAGNSIRICFWSEVYIKKICVQGLTDKIEE